MAGPERELWSLEETARRLSLTVAEVERCLDDGELPKVEVAGQTLVPAEAVARLIDETLVRWDRRKPAAAYLTAEELDDVCDLLCDTGNMLRAHAAPEDASAARFGWAAFRLQRVAEHLLTRQLEVELDGLPPGPLCHREEQVADRAREGERS